MLFGTEAWEINHSYSRGFFCVCCACGWNSYVKIDAPSVRCVIIECTREECGQQVMIVDGKSEIWKESKYVSPTKANMS